MVEECDVSLPFAVEKCDVAVVQDGLLADTRCLEKIYKDDTARFPCTVLFHVFPQHVANFLHSVEQATLLHSCAEFGCVHIAKLLLSCKANVDAKDSG